MVSLHAALNPSNSPRVLPLEQPGLGQAHALLTQLAQGSSASLLVYGPLGLGLLQVAHHWAAGQLCEQPNVHANAKPCGQCASCHMVAAHQHPDLQQLLPASMATELGLLPSTSSKKDSKPSAEIRMDDLRNLHTFFYTTSTRGARRFLLVYPFEALNSNTANALLKILEEPPEGLCMVLLGQQPQALLATVRSRCRRIALPGPSSAALTAWWAAQGVDQPEQLLALLLPHETNAPWLLDRQAAQAQLQPRRAWVQYLAAGAKGSPPAGCEAMGLRVAITLALRMSEAWLQTALHMPPPPGGGMAGLHGNLSWAKPTQLAPCLALAQAWQRMLRHADHPIGVRLTLEMMAEQWHTLYVAC